MLETILKQICDIAGAEPDEIDANTELFEEGILDSFGLVQLVVALEGEGLHLDIAELTRDDLSTPAKIAALLGA